MSALKRVGLLLLLVIPIWLYSLESLFSRQIFRTQLKNDLRTCSPTSFRSAVDSFVSSNSRKPKALVTGAAGFIGSHVADICQRDLGMQVVAVDDLSGGKEENLDVFKAEGGIFVHGDLRNVTFVNNLFDEHGPFQYVYHIAAYAAEGLSHFIRHYNYENNLLASVHLINACANQRPLPKAFIVTSSIAAFGPSDGILPLKENSPMRPEDPYGIAKMAVELDLQAARHMFDLPFIIFRPHNVYGPRQNIADKFRNAVGIFMNQILRSEDITIFGSGDQTRAFSYIDDVATVIASSVAFPHAYNDSYFVGDNKHYSVIELAHSVLEAMLKVQGAPLASRIKHLHKRMEVEHAYADHSKLHCTFNFKAKVDLHQGLLRTAEYVKLHGSAKPTGYSNIEVALNMPPSWLQYFQDLAGTSSFK